MNYFWQRLTGAVLTMQLLGSCQPAGSAAEVEATAPLVTYQAAAGMDKQEFWRIIGFAHAQAKGDEQVQENLLIDALSKYEPAEITEFECLLEQQLQAANTFGIIAAEKVMDDYVSDDSFLYFRCWLVAQGEKVFTEVVRNPDSLADVVTKGAATEFELLLYVSTAAYQRKTGKREEDASFPRSVASERGLNYDSGRGPSGQEWTSAQLPTLLPKLWTRYR